MRVLVTGVSGYVGAALVPALEREGHAVRGFARSPERVAAAGVALDDLVIGDALTGAGLDRALDGVDVAYYLIHSMEGAAGGALPRAGAPRGRAASPPRRGAAGVRRIVYLGGLVPRGRRGVAPPRLAAGRRGGAAGRRAGVDRPARLDRDRRPLALVPLPRAADRAAARARAARLARATARGRSTAATCSPTWPPPPPRRPSSPAARGTSPGPDVMTYQELIERIADVDARRRARSWASASR